MSHDKVKALFTFGVIEVFFFHISNNIHFYGKQHDIGNQNILLNVYKS